jgi:hypothetical protein
MHSHVQGPQTGNSKPKWQLDLQARKPTSDPSKQACSSEVKNVCELECSAAGAPPASPLVLIDYWDLGQTIGKDSWDRQLGQAVGTGSWDRQLGQAVGTDYWAKQLGLHNGGCFKHHGTALLIL